jgi:hypothetical protein
MEAAERMSRQSHCTVPGISMTYRSDVDSRLKGGHVGDYLFMFLCILATIFWQRSSSECTLHLRELIFS